MAKSTSSAYQIGQIVMVRVERVTPFGVDVRLCDDTPAYACWQDLTRGGHWDPNKVVTVGQEVEARVVALSTPERLLEVGFTRQQPTRALLREIAAGLLVVMGALMCFDILQGLLINPGLWILPAILKILGHNGGTWRKDCMMDRASTVDWEIEQLVKAHLFPDQQAVVRSALRALFQAQLGVRQQMIASAQTAGDISLGKAAELMGVSNEEMKDILVESGVEVHLGPRTAEEVLQGAANA